MHRKLDTMPTEAHFSERESSLDLQNLLHPARAFEHPRHVVNDPDLTLNEKRAILASWASDVCAVEAAPALRHAPGGAEPVRFDDVMDSLRDLDKHAKDQTNVAARYRRVLRRGRLMKSRGCLDRDKGPSLN